MPARHDELLHLTDTEAIRLALPDGPVLAVGDHRPGARMSIDLRREDLFTRIRRALRAIIVEENRLLEVTANSPFNHTNEVQVLLQEHRTQPGVAAFRRRFRGPVAADRRRDRRAGLLCGAASAGPSDAPDHRQHRRLPRRSRAHHAARSGQCHRVAER